MKKPILALSILVLLLEEEATGHSIEKKLSEFNKKLASSPTGSSLPTPLTSDKKKVRD
jgi:DNA-binding PadR family transcriptional regulator